jgi:WXG100 family type VII secretion target
MPQFNVATEEVIQAGKTINSLSAQIEDLIRQCKQTAEGAREAWTGNASGAFEDAMTQWNTAALAVKTAAADLGRATSTAGTNYADTEATNTSMFH